MINRIKNKINRLDIHTIEVFKKTSSSMIVKVLGVLARLLVSIFLGRVLGKEGLGDISLVNQTITIVMIFTMFGMDNVIVKQVSLGFSNKDYNLIGSTTYTSLIVNGTSSLLMAIFGVFCSNYIATFFNSANLVWPLIIAFIVIFPQTIGRVYTSGINGYRKTWQSNFFKETQTSILVLIGLLLFWLFKLEVTIVNVIILYSISRFLTFITVAFYWKKLFRKITQKVFLGKSMLKTAIPLLLVSATTIIASSADVIMLGWLKDSSEVGLYSVASRLALFITFFLQVSNSAISPKIASLYAEKRIPEMKVMVNKVTSGLILVGVFMFFCFLILGKFVLSLWGEGFVEAYLILIILALGQVVNLSTGCSGLLLIMCNYEKTHGYISVTFVVINLLLNYFLIIKLGAVGAAIATSLTVIGENLFKVIFAYKKTGVLTIPFLKAN